MTLEPRLIEPGYLWRWLKRGVALVGVNFHVWFALALAYCALLFWLRAWGLLLVPLGVVFNYFSVEMALAGTQRMLGPVEALGLLKHSAIQAGAEVWRQRWRVLAMLATIVGLQLMLVGFSFYVGSDLWAEQNERIARADFAQLSTWLFAPTSPFLPAAFNLLLASAVVDRGKPFGFVTYPLRQRFGVNVELAEHLRQRAFRKNATAGLNANLGEFFLILGALTLVPFLAPFLLCLLPAMHGVVFKELFDPEGLPSVEATLAPAPKLAPASTRS